MRRVSEIGNPAALFIIAGTLSPRPLLRSERSVSLPRDVSHAEPLIVLRETSRSPRSMPDESPGPASRVKRARRGKTPFLRHFASPLCTTPGPTPMRLAAG